MTPGTAPRFTFAGAELDPTGLYHMGARYYAADVGRFHARDPIGAHGYAYARDNPLSFVDPSGLDAEPQNDLVIPDWLFGPVGGTASERGVAPAEVPAGNAELVGSGATSALPAPGRTVGKGAEPGVSASAAGTLDARVWAGSAEGKTTGFLNYGDEEVYLESGWNGPTEEVPRGTEGFDIVTRTHVEGHAAAVMGTEGVPFAELQINSIPCPSCVRLLPQMLPTNAVLVIYGPGGFVGVYVGR